MIKKISQISSIFTGFTFRMMPLGNESGSLVVIQPKDIDPIANVLNVETALRVSDFSGDNKYILRQGDILLGNKGKNTPVILIGNPGIDMVASSAFTVIRPMQEKGVDPNYLAWYLQLPVTQNYFQSTKVGSTVLNLLTKSVQDTEIHLPTLIEQKKIGSIYSSLIEQNAKQVLLMKKYFQLINEELFEKINGSYGKK